MKFCLKAKNNTGKNMEYIPEFPIEVWLVGKLLSENVKGIG